jgi:hypothetical protein
MLKSSIVVYIFLTLIGCRNQDVDKAYAAGEVWYRISNTPNPDKIFFAIDLPDSSLFYYFLEHENRLRIIPQGAFFNCNKIKSFLPAIGAYNINYTIIIGESTSPLLELKKSFLDSLIIETNKKFEVTIEDTATSSKWEFLNSQLPENEKNKIWFKNVPAWLFMQN